MGEKSTMNFRDLRVGQIATVERIEGGRGSMTRLERLGIREGVKIRKISDSYPIIAEVGGSNVAIGKGMASNIVVSSKNYRALLFGNPNVGKSVVFSRLTGLSVISSNYPGTTVDYSRGNLTIEGNSIEIIDVPGAYTLEATCTAEEIAKEFCEKNDYDLIVNIVDATNLERNLYLTLQLLERKKPTIVALNKWDIARHRGITIDVAELSSRLGVPVVPIVAVTAQGFKDLTFAMLSVIRNEIPPPNLEPIEHAERWHIIGHISQEVQTIAHKHPSLWEKLEKASLRPITGTLFALLIFGMAFFIIRFIGEGLINYVLDPFFQKAYGPAIKWLVDFIPISIVRDLLVGKLPGFMDSFGVLTTGFYIPIVIVLPYIIAFYLILGFLEDFGYLPRLAVLLDNVMHKLGLHGYAAIPLILGCGCKVPGILSLRILESKREKFLALVLMMMAVPCFPQSAMIFSLLSPFGARYVAMVFLILVLVAIINSIFLTKILKSTAQEMIMEIPSYQIPHLGTLIKKLFLRLKIFFIDAVPAIVVGIFLINIFDIIGLMSMLEKVLGPFVTSILGLPRESVGAVLFGFLRKDTSIAILTPLNLTAKQGVIGSIFLVLYLPCIASFFVILKETGWKYTLKLLLLTFSWATFACFLLHILWR